MNTILVKLKILTPWKDICTFAYGGSSGYLLQGKRNRITNRATFKVVQTGSKYGVVQTHIHFDALQKHLPQIEIT